MFPATIKQKKVLKNKFRKIFKVYNKNKYSTLPKDEIKKEKRKQKKGIIGELWTRLVFKIFLPSDCIIMNDVVLEISPNFFNQFDHIILSPKGIYIVDTKNWRKNRWDIHPEKWSLLNSSSHQTINDKPSKQRQMHLDSMRFWLKDNFEYYDQIKEFMFSKIILLGAKINKNYNDFDIVNKSGHIVNYIKAFPGNNISYDILFKLAKALECAKPLNHWEWIHTHYNINDSRTVKLNVSSKKEAEEIKSIYRMKGFITSPIVIKDNCFCFNIKNHIEYVEEKMKKTSLDEYTSIMKKERLLFTANFIKTLIILSICCFTLYSIIYKMTIEYKDIQMAQSKIENTVGNSNNNEEDLVVMTFKVNKDYSYIMIRDGKNNVFEKFRCKKGTEIIFYKSKKVLINDIEGDIIEHTFVNDIIEFDVGNDRTEIIQGGEKYHKRSVIVKYDFINDIILD